MVRRPTPAIKRKFENLCRLEPRLWALYEQIRQVKDDKSLPSFCANRLWYQYRGQPDGFKRQLQRLVGYERVDEPDEERLLSSSDAYDTAYSVLYYALPDCRNCNC